MGLFRKKTEEESRKARSETILKKESIPVNRLLPSLEAEAKVLQRTTSEVAERTLALCMVAMKGGSLDSGQATHEDVLRHVEKHTTMDWFSPKELEFIMYPNPDRQSIINATYRFECLWVMLWALGFVESLGRPDSLCDPNAAQEHIAKRGTRNFMEQSQLRAYSEILDQADLIYRYHWAVRDSQLHGRDAPVELNCDVVQERHYALNWLIGYGGEWDHVSTDT